MIYFCIMPLVLIGEKGDACLTRRLQDAGIPVLDETSASRQDMRPARIGLLNLMPFSAMADTEIQWLEWVGREPVLQIEPVLVKFDDDPREKDASRRQEILKRYTPFSDAAELGLDGLIVTGDNLELKQHAGVEGIGALPFERISYYRQLLEVIGWADKNTRSTVYSCLAAHLALNHLYGVPREITKDKTFGVFDHDILDRSSPFVQGMNDSVIAPHSRWGNMSVYEIEKAKQLKLLAVSPAAGWLALERPNAGGGTDLFLQGHPEYDRLGLHYEFLRDRAKGLALPPNYYYNQQPTEGNVMLTWSTDARVLHENWIGEVYRLFSQPTEPTNEANL